MAFTISGTSGLTFPDTTTMTTGSQSVKAWVNFSGETINASYNVSSVTVNATGDWTVTFATAMSSASYCVVGTSRANVSLGPYGGSQVVNVANATAPTASAVRVINSYQDDNSNVTTGVNATSVSVAIFR